MAAAAEAASKRSKGKKPLKDIKSLGFRLGMIRVEGLGFQEEVLVYDTGHHEPWVSEFLKLQGIEVLQDIKSHGFQNLLKLQGLDFWQPLKDIKSLGFKNSLKLQGWDSVRF